MLVFVAATRPLRLPDKSQIETRDCLSTRDRKLFGPLDRIQTDALLSACLLRELAGEALRAERLVPRTADSGLDADAEKSRLCSKASRPSLAGALTDAFAPKRDLLLRGGPMAPANAGRTYPPAPLHQHEVEALLQAAGSTVPGLRAQALLAVCWRVRASPRPSTWRWQISTQHPAISTCGSRRARSLAGSPSTRSALGSCSVGSRPAPA